MSISRQIASNDVVPLLAGQAISTGALTVTGSVNALTALALNNKTFAQAISVYHYIFDQAANGAVVIGSGGDPTNYYRNTSHVFGSISGSTTYGTWGATGLAINTGVLSVPVKSNFIGTNGGTIATGALAQSDANVIFYNESSTNWAGVGCDNSGNIWFRTGLSGTPGAALWFASTDHSANFLSSILSVGPTSGIGYATGAGGTITQITSRTTGVSLNTVSGAITLFAAAPTVGTWVSFTVTNTAVAATDTVSLSVKSGTNTYIAHVTAVASSSFQISFTSIVGTASDSPVINFNVIKGVAS